MPLLPCKACYGQLRMDDIELLNLAAELGLALKARDLKLALAE